ncbi:TaqI-like C-terminal specificity domain-containing protein [Raineya sp.]|jgi:site-specific DNA-methyltransferase (adenine-specific)
MQINIFGEVEPYGLTIEQAAKKANVSTATIRNWIKTGYLIQNNKGLVLQESFEKFMSDVAGKEKLKARANKLLKDAHLHKHKDKLTFIQTKFGEDIGKEYENSLTESYRNKEGIYYTPSWIVRDMLKDIPIQPNFTFLDPCCGSGNFIIEAIRKGVLPENVYGFDTDENAVWITKKRIKDEFGFESNNIKVGNFLEEAYKLQRGKRNFDLIFTNPPWGKKIEKSEKRKYASVYQCGDSLDTTSLFLGASLLLLKPNGYMGFLTQEAFFNITAFEFIRKKVLEKKILKFTDYGKAFKGLLTKAQAIILENKLVKFNDKVECCTENATFQRSIQSFIQMPRQILNFWTTEEEAKVIKHLYSIQHFTLKNRATWALGIVTGNNKKFCINEPREGYVPIYKGSDITKSGLKEPTCFILNDFSKFQQVAPIELYQSKEKVIYRFICSDLCFYFDTGQHYILNSANLFIPQNIPLKTQQLTELLNSEVMNWLFKKLFATHKVLRGDLEQLPIHFEYFEKYSDFSENAYLDYLQLIKTENGTYRVKE